MCRNTGMCHYFGYLSGLIPDFRVPFSAIPDFWVSFLAITRFLGVIFLVKFDFLQNNPDFLALILIFY